MPSPRAIWHVILMAQRGAGPIRRVPSSGVYAEVGRGQADVLRRAARDLLREGERTIASRSHLAYEDGLLADPKAPCQIANWVPEDLDPALA